MADVNIQQTPSGGETRSGGSGAVWAVVVVVLLLIIAWFVFGGGLTRRSTTRVDINANVPGQTSGGGGATKTPTKTP